MINGLMSRQSGFSLKVLAVICALLAAASGTRAQTSSVFDVELRPAETVGEWRVLFDGETLDGWRGYKREDVPGAWRVENGRMVLNAYKWWWGRIFGRGALITTEQYTNFELELEWMIAKGGNSGVMFGVQERDDAKFAHDSGVEIQILDDENNRLNRKSPLQRAGAIYGVFPAVPNVAKPFGEFNKVRLRVQGGKVVHYLNDVEIARFDMNSPAWSQAVANSSHDGRKHYGKYRNGHIALQDHLHRVEFRNVRIRELPE